MVSFESTHQLVLNIFQLHGTTLTQLEKHNLAYLDGIMSGRLPWTRDDDYHSRHTGTFGEVHIWKRIVDVS